MIVRPEGPSDRDAVRRVHATAFKTPEEADLVDALRAGAALTRAGLERCREIGTARWHAAFDGL